MHLQIQYPYVAITKDGHILGEDSASGGYPWATNNEYPPNYKFYRTLEEAQSIFKHDWNYITERHGAIRIVKLTILVEELDAIANSARY